MIIIAPEVSERTTGTVFLAGGITNCPDWQNPTAEVFRSMTNLTVFSPRRVGWNMDDNEKESVRQIEWEHAHLKRSETVLFWFPMETLCPITLLELGKLLVSDKRLVIGTHPEYQRRLDVIVQTRLERPNLKVWSNLDDMVHTFVRDHRITS